MQSRNYFDRISITFREIDIPLASENLCLICGFFFLGHVFLRAGTGQAKDQPTTEARIDRGRLLILQHPQPELGKHLVHRGRLWLDHPVRFFR